jgi:hypothetical protein
MAAAGERGVAARLDRRQQTGFSKPDFAAKADGAAAGQRVKIGPPKTTRE